MFLFFIRNASKCPRKIRCLSVEFDTSQYFGNFHLKGSSSKKVKGNSGYKFFISIFSMSSPTRKKNFNKANFLRNDFFGICIQNKLQPFFKSLPGKCYSLSSTRAMDHFSDKCITFSFIFSNFFKELARFEVKVLRILQSIINKKNKSIALMHC